MVRVASIFLAALPLVAAQKFDLLYFDDENCTTASYAGDLTTNTTQYGITGPLDTCINVTAAGSYLSNFYKAIKVSNCFEASNYSYGLTLDAHECGATAMQVTVPVATGAQCQGPSGTTGKYFTASCSTSTAWDGLRSTITITTTHAAITAGSWDLRYFTDNACTIPYNQSGVQVQLDGPLGQCTNVTATGSYLGALYKAAQGADCYGSAFTLNINTAANACPDTGMIPVPVPSSVCSYSATLQQYFMATCSAAGWSGATTEIITTTHAPINEGSWDLKYYTDNACSLPYNQSGAQVQLDGPLGRCTNTTATGSYLAALYKGAMGVNCVGSSYTLNINTGAAACPDTGMIPAPVVAGTCTYSATLQQYFMGTCSSAVWTGETTEIVTTTHAPINSGSWDLKYYTDNACSIPYNASGAQVQLDGPLGQCTNMTATGSYLAALYKGAMGVNCLGSSFTLNINTAAAACPDTGMIPAPVVANVCTYSSTLQQYFVGTCSSAPWTGATTEIIPHAPISVGSFSLKYYTDNACTLPYSMSGAAVELSGPMGTCLNTTAAGSPLSAMYKGAQVTDCNGAQFTININTAAHSCASGLIAVPAPAHTCSYSSSLQQYFLATCSSTAWDGATSHVIGNVAVSGDTTTGGASSDTTVAATTVASSETTVAGGDGTTVAPTTAAAAAVVQVQASYQATEDLPTGVTATQLLASTVYTTAKQTGVANALGVAVSKVTVDGFVLARRRLTTKKGRKLASTTVTTNYSVEVAAAQATAMETSVASNSIAATIQTETTTAMAAADWSSEPVLTAAPTITVDAVSYVGTVTQAPAATPTSSMAFGTNSMLVGSILAAILMLF